MKNRIAFFLLIAVGASVFLCSCCKKINSVKNNETNFKGETSKSQAGILWKELSHQSFNLPDTAKIHYKNYKLFSLDSLLMQQLLAKSPTEKQVFTESLIHVIELPRPDNGLVKFAVYRTTVMDSALEARFPLLKTYGGYAIDNKAITVRLDFNPNGFHAYVTGTDGEWFIQPAAKGITHQHLLCFFKKDVILRNRQPFELSDSLGR